MPAWEYFGWEQHFRRWPPGDTLGHQLLATLCSLVANAAFQLKQPGQALRFCALAENARRRRRRAPRQNRSKSIGLVEEAYREKSP